MYVFSSHTVSVRTAPFLMGRIEAWEAWADTPCVVCSRARLSG